MPVVLVHGVPDTHRVWNKLRAELQRRDAMALSLPGFGNPLPDGFAPTKEAYTEWLVAELARLDGPLDVVGHDWGSLLVLRALMLNPGPIRSWAVGGAPLDPDYVWHAAARTWQTPGTGEQMMAMMTAQTIPAGLAAAGLPHADGVETAKYVDDTMKRCILGLYRSAVHVGAEWGPELPRIKKPGLVIWGERDPYAELRFGRFLAEKSSADFVSIPDCGHWWQVQRPAEVARALEKFWQTLG